MESFNNVNKQPEPIDEETKRAVDPRAVTILTITNMRPDHVALWINYNILNIRLPVPDANSTIGPSHIAPYLAEINNRNMYATELYNIVVGAATDLRTHKKTLFKMVSNAEEQYNRLKDIQDILHRTIQTLTTLYEGASRLITATDAFNSMLNRRS